MELKLRLVRGQTLGSEVVPDVKRIRIVSSGSGLCWVCVPLVMGVFPVLGSIKVEKFVHPLVPSPVIVTLRFIALDCSGSIFST